MKGKYSLTLQLFLSKKPKINYKDAAHHLTMTTKVTHISK